METSLSLAELLYDRYRRVREDYFYSCFMGMASESEVDACCRLLTADRDEWEHLTSLLMQEEKSKEVRGEYVSVYVENHELNDLAADFTCTKHRGINSLDKLQAVNQYIMTAAMKYAMRNSIPPLFERVVREHRADFEKYDREPDYLSRAA